MTVYIYLEKKKELRYISMDIIKVITFIEIIVVNCGN